MLFPKLWSHFLGFFFLVLFSIWNKNKISGNSDFSKINFSPNKSKSCRLNGDARENMWVHRPRHLWYVWWLVHGEDEIWEGPRWFLSKKSRESTSTGPGTGTCTSRSWVEGIDSRDRGWSRPSKWLLAERVQAWHSSTPNKGCLVWGYLLRADVV